jgi:Raf kinase inhibitor-like YbhB/YbcL family protein
MASNDPFEGLPQASSFTVTSASVADGKPLPAAQMSGMLGIPGGRDASPQLSWSDAPEGTKSYAVTIYDPDAPTMSGFWHWAVANIPATVTSLPEGAGDDTGSGLPHGAVQLPNDRRDARFVGAVPPPGHGPHRIVITVHALDVADIAVPADATPAFLVYSMGFHTIARAALIAAAETPAAGPAGDVALDGTMTITSGDGTPIEAFSARPPGPGSAGGVIVLHSVLGYDDDTKRFARSLAAAGYNTVVPYLFHREAPGAAPNEALAAARAKHTPPLLNDQVVADAAGAAAYLRGLPGSNGKVGAVGLGFGGYLAFLVATSIPVDAAVNCYGTWIGNAPPAQAPMAGAPQIIDRAPLLRAPLLGLFGAEDQTPSAAQVAELEQALKDSGKTHEFHSYEGAGHGFFAEDRPSYRADAAADGHQRILTWLGRYLG